MATGLRACPGVRSTPACIRQSRRAATTRDATTGADTTVSVPSWSYVRRNCLAPGPLGVLDGAEPQGAIEEQDAVRRRTAWGARVDCVSRQRAGHLQVHRGGVLVRRRPGYGSATLPRCCSASLSERKSTVALGEGAVATGEDGRGAGRQAEQVIAAVRDHVDGEVVAACRDGTPAAVGRVPRGGAARGRGRATSACCR